MKTSRRAALGAAVAPVLAAALVAAACGGPASGGGTAGGGAVGGVHNPSDATGGTLRFANSGDWDSLDPADTYYAYSWNFIRNYGRALVMFQPAPGADLNITSDRP